jgi:glycosyltransferase involved in cell wall biosynthesis
MTRPRLLAVSHDFTLTGAPIVLFNALQGLKTNYDITVVSKADGELRKELQRADIQTEIVANVLSDLNVTTNLLDNFDVLFANTLNTYFSIHAAHRSSKPSIWYIHEGHFGLQFLKTYAPAMEQAFPLASRVVMPCQFAHDLYAEWLGTRPAEIVPYGVHDQDLPTPQPPDRRVQLLQIGSFESRKAQDIALAAFRILNDDRFVLHFVGHVMDQNYRYRVHREFIDVPNIRYWSGAPREHALSLIGDCDVLIVPSRDEVTPLVILEAMSLGRPIIASRVCGIPEMIEDGVTGFLFEKDNSQQLADLLRRVGLDAELRQKVGLEAREFQRQHRNVEDFSARFDQILRELLEMELSGPSAT